MISNHGKIKYIQTTSTINDDDIQYIILASDGVWDALSIDEIKSIFHNTLNGSANNDSTKYNNDKIIPTNVNTLDNIYYNNKGNCYYYSFLLLFINVYNYYNLRII